MTLAAARMRRGVTTLTALAVFTTFGCGEVPTYPAPPISPQGDPRDVPARILVVNTLSETISSLDPATDVLHVQAALGGTWTNRITAMPDRRQLLVTNSGSNEVIVLDAIDLAVIRTIDLGPGRNPWTTVAVDGWHAIISNWLAGTVRLAVAATGTIGPPLATTPGPEGMATTNGLAWIACTNYRSDGDWDEGRVDLVDLAAWRVVGSIPVGRNPQEIIVGPDGNLHVLCTGTYGGGATPEAGSIHVLEPNSRTTVGVIDLGGSPGRLAANTNGEVWVVGFGGGLRRYDAASRTLLPEPTDPSLLVSGLSAIAFDEKGEFAYITWFDGDLLLRVDVDAVVVTDAWITGDGPVDVLVN